MSALLMPSAIFCQYEVFRAFQVLFFAGMGRAVNNDNAIINIVFMDFLL
jgi:hypothetical protein